MALLLAEGQDLRIRSRGGRPGQPLEGRFLQRKPLPQQETFPEAIPHFGVLLTPGAGLSQDGCQLSEVSSHQRNHSTPLLEKIFEHLWIKVRVAFQDQSRRCKRAQVPRDKKGKLILVDNLEGQLGPPQHRYSIFQGLGGCRVAALGKKGDSLLLRPGKQGFLEESFHIEEQLHLAPFHPIDVAGQGETPISVGYDHRTGIVVPIRPLDRQVHVEIAVMLEETVEET